MWPFTKTLKEKSMPFVPPFISEQNREMFFRQSSDLLIHKILRDAFSYGLSFTHTSVPLYPQFNASLGNTKVNKALSLFEVCQKILRLGSFRYTYLSKTNAGYSDDLSLSPYYSFYEAKSPFSSMESPFPFVDLIRTPLGILYEINQSFLLKQKLFRDKLILYVDGLRNFGNQTSASFVDIFRESVKEQAKDIFTSSNLWIFDANDRLEQPNFISPEIQTSIDFSYSEISRITGIPQTHLIGKSPDGLNASGKSDEENYQKILRGLLDSLIIPILKIGDPEYKAPHSLDTKEVALTLDILKSLYNEENGLTSEQKQTLGASLLASLDY